MYIMGRLRLTKINFGRLIFRGAYASFLSYIGTALELLIIHCVDNGYDTWLTNFFDSVTVGKLVIDRFSVQTDTGIEEREFVLRSFHVPWIAVRGIISFSLFDLRNCNVRELWLHPGPNTPFLIPTYIYSNFEFFTTLTSLSVSYSDITDRGLISICAALKNLEELDISGCVKLSILGLSHLKYLPNLKYLSTAYVDLTYECVSDLRHLEYLYACFVNIVKLDLFRLLCTLSKLKSVCTFSAQPLGSESLDAYLRVSLAMLMLRTIEIPVTLFCINFEFTSFSRL